MCIRDSLEREISFNQPQPLLVVMPAGFGIANAGPTGALTGLKVDSAHQANGLARSAILAVARIARAAGKSIKTGSLPSASGPGGGGTSPLITFGGPAGLVLAAVLMLGLVRRRATVADESTDPSAHTREP